MLSAPQACQGTIRCLTDGLPGAIHRFYDTSPISPSGRYLAVTQLPSEEREPRPGEKARVWVVDLERATDVACMETACWDTQLGAQAQWGASDEEVFLNDLDKAGRRAMGIAWRWRSDECRALPGSVYMLHQGQQLAVSPDLAKLGLTQLGYGFRAPNEAELVAQHNPKKDGIWVSDTAHGGPTQLWMSIAEMLEREPLLREEVGEDVGSLFCFHTKISPDGDRLMVVLRWADGESGPTQRRWVLAIDRETRRVKRVVSSRRWSRGGHHPNFSPDGRSILMNLMDARGFLRFVSIDCDSGREATVCPALLGGGHPSWHPSKPWVLTDSYLREPHSVDEEHGTIRLVDAEKHSEAILAIVPQKPLYPGIKNSMRMDPHPVWTADGERIVFNGLKEGRRAVFELDPS